MLKNIFPEWNNRLRDKYLFTDYIRTNVGKRAIDRSTDSYIQ